jgi:hypothetical protein
VALSVFRLLRQIGDRNQHGQAERNGNQES